MDGSSILQDGVGSLLYCAPERLLFKEHGKRSDIWSLGVIFYEILAGRKPYYTRDEIVNLALNPLPDWVPVHIRDFVSKLLDKDKTKRP